MQTIVVGYDGTDLAERALSRAADFAEGLGGKVVVVTVGPSAIPRPELVAAEGLDPLMPAGRMTAVFPPLQDVEAESEPGMRTLERARRTLAARRVEADYVSAVGDPAEVLLETADARDADLVVVGSREHGFLERLLGAGVDEKLARGTRCDVLLVH
jgi:nucleotide-binding universal stress UspA family protein